LQLFDPAFLLSFLEMYVSRSGTGRVASDVPWPYVTQRNGRGLDVHID
jgi:hypothetical protein